MIRTDVWKIDLMLRYIEQTEVRNALKHFDGKYSWEGKEENVPIIAINPSDGEGPVDLRVQTIEIDKHDTLYIKGYNIHNCSEDFGIWSDEVVTGHLNFILDYLPKSDIDVRYEKRNRDAKLCRDGFVWKIVTPDKARDIWKAGLFELYKLYPDNSEGLIEREVELEEAISQGIDIGIEVGFIQ